MRGEEKNSHAISFKKAETNMQKGEIAKSYLWYFNLAPGS